MIVRTADRPIRYDDLKLGSIITIINDKKELQEYIITKKINKTKNKPFVEGLRIITGESGGSNTISLEADKVVLLNRTRIIKPGTVQSVQTGLPREVIEKVLRAETEYQRLEKDRKMKALKDNPKVSRIEPKDSTNTAWKSLEHVSKGFIHIYKG